MEVLYICDRKACGDKCGDHCQHTTNIQHAANFRESEMLPGLMVEIEKEMPKGCQPFNIETVPLSTKTENDNCALTWFVLSVILWAITVAVTLAAAVV